MFRESDYVAPKLHSTYSNKPTPVLQSHAQSSRLETKHDIHNKPIVDQAIPVTYDTIYDPKNPYADWSGFVSKANHQKKHCADHSSKIVSLEQTDHGIVGKNEKQLYRPKVDTMSILNNDRFRDTSSIISGIDVPNQSERWISNSRRQMEFESTEKFQLSVVKRLGSKKTIPDPAQSHSNMRNPFDEVINAEIIEQYRKDSTPRMRPENESQQGENSTLIGYRAPAAASKSLLSNLGSTLSTHMLEPPPKSSVTSASYSKDLIGENYKPLPGN